MKPNSEIRSLLKEKNICLWQLAMKIGIHETTLISWLRVEPLPEDHRKRIFDAMVDLQEGDNGGQESV